MTQRVIVVGAGEFGREIHTWVTQAIGQGLPWTLDGFLDDRPDALDRFAGLPPIVGSVREYQPTPDDRFLCAVGTPEGKRKVFELLMARGGRFATFVHPTALIGRNVELGEGTIVCPFTQLSCDIRLGRLVTFGTFSNSAHDTVIGDFVQISGSCEINGRAVIGEGAFVGSHATILPGAKVGPMAFVGAGSVVLRRVSAGAKVFGNPAVPVGASRD
jgi:sugar O-acyltransferase (sialic acid O-acetyltransferase NeuD family)